MFKLLFIFLPTCGTYMSSHSLLALYNLQMGGFMRAFIPLVERTEPNSICILIRSLHITFFEGLRFAFEQMLCKNGRLNFMRIIRPFSQS